MRTKNLFVAALAGLVVLSAACGGTPPSNNNDAGVTPDAGNGAQDKTPPTIISSHPLNGQADIPVNTPVSVEFSEEMDIGSVSLTSSPQITLSAADWSFGNTLVQMAVSTPLTGSTQYTLTLNGKDKAGNAMAEKTITFTTVAVDSMAPALNSSVPANGMMDAPISSELKLFFSEPMDISTVAVTGTPSVAFAEPVWTADNSQLALTPLAELAPLTSFTFTIEGKDLAGNALPATTVAFKTGSPPDNTAPTVVSTSPADNATGVNIATNVTFTFSEPMNKASVESSLVLSPARTCLFAWDANATQVSCIPDTPFDYSTTYTAGMSRSATDVAGNMLPSDVLVTFTTGAAPDSTPPTVASFTPAQGALGIVRSSPIVVTFSEPMNKATAQAAFSITSPGGFNGGSFAWNTAGTEMTYSPPAALPADTQISWSVNTAAQDVAGNAMQAAVTHSFRTVVIHVLNLSAVAYPTGYVTAAQTLGNATPRAGDDNNNQISTGYFTFDLTSVPASGINITSAVFTTLQGFKSGNPYSMGDLKVESVDYGNMLTSGAASAPVLNNLSFVLASAASNPAQGASLSTTVTSKVLDDLANRAARGNRCQFRSRFANATNNNNAYDTVSLYADATSCRLTITYESAN